MPDSGPTVASRTVHGRRRQAGRVRGAGVRTLVDAGFARRPHARRVPPASPRYVETVGSLRATSQYEPPPGIAWDDEQYHGDAYGTYALGRRTSPKCRSTPTPTRQRGDDFVAVQEVGRVINPMLAAGQIEGGVAQGIGWALYENVVWRDGRMVNAQMTNYIMPTSMDLPHIRVFFEECPYALRPRAAPRASASCRWTARRRRSSTPIADATGVASTGCR